MSTAVITTTVTDNSVAPLVRVGQPRLRLTKRGRAVFTGLAATPVVVAVMLLALNGGGATATSADGGALEQVTLQAGQSLWDLAEEIAPGTDPRDVISDILAVNELGGGSVQAGQRLDLPAEYSSVE